VNTDPTIGNRFFTDGTLRPVYRDDQGQYVLADASEKVYCHWLLTEDDDPDFTDWSDVSLTVLGTGNHSKGVRSNEHPRGRTGREPPLRW
jgi:hypothetical protein